MDLVLSTFKAWELTLNSVTYSEDQKKSLDVLLKQCADSDFPDTTEVVINRSAKFVMIKRPRKSILFSSGSYRFID